MPKMALEEALAAAREIAADVVAGESERVDVEAQWPENGVRALQQAGLGGLVVPEESGGLGFGMLALAQTCEILGQECASTGLCYGMHCVASAVIAAKASANQKERYLEPIAAGKHLTSLALSEPGTGAHFYYPEAKLETSSPDSFTVSGTKCFVTNGGHADSYVISTVAAEPDAPMGQFSFALVPAAADGLKWGKEWKGIGMRGNSSRTVELDNIKLPREGLLGDEGDQIWYVFHVVGPYFITAMSGTYLGIAAAALEETRQHLMHRRHSHSGGTLSETSVLQHRVGCLWGALERARQLLYHAARAGDDTGSDALPLLCLAKAEVADSAVEIVNECLTLCGGIAYADGSKSAKHLRDVRAAHVMSPTTELLRIWAGRALLDLPILGD